MKFILAPLMLATASVSVVGCATGPKEPQLTPLELQSIQSRTFEEDKSVVFSSVMSVFQDLGYTINQADVETGFISGLSTTKGGFTSGLMTALLTGASTSTTTQTGVTAFIEDMDDESRVRLNFVVKKDTTGKFGSRRNDTAIVKPEPYISAFEKIETAVFVRTSQ